MKIYCRGKIIEETECRLSTADHGFLFGISLFETFRTFNGKPFLLDAHLRRLQQACKAFEIRLQNDLLFSDPEGEKLQPILRKLLKQNNLADAVFRCTVSAGPISENPEDGFYQNPQEFILIRPLPPPPPKEGIALHILNQKRRPPEFSPRPKSGNFAENILALQELKKRASIPTDEGLLLTADGRISEGTHTNLFIIKENRLLTPPPSTHLLEGITRKTVLELASKSKIETLEKNLFPDDFKDANAVFTTNSVRGLTPVAAIFDKNNRLIRKIETIKNPIFRHLLQIYQNQLPPNR